MSPTFVRHPSSLSLQCTCGNEARYSRIFQPADGVTDHIDVYVCPLGHMVQVVYPSLQSSFDRLKPSTPPSFPGGAQF